MFIIMTSYNYYQYCCLVHFTWWLIFNPYFQEMFKTLRWQGKAFSTWNDIREKTILFTVIELHKSVSKCIYSKCIMFPVIFSQAEATWKTLTIYFPQVEMFWQRTSLDSQSVALRRSCLSSELLFQLPCFLLQLGEDQSKQ